MIRNRLGILMAERGIKISDVFDATKISRSTLTSISQNESKMIQLETIDSLCNYFNITPNDFFDYAPYILKYDSYMEKDRFEALNKPVNYKEKLKEYGNDDERTEYLLIEKIDLFGCSKFIIEISVKKVEKNYQYLLGVNFFLIDESENSNAPKDYDIVVELEDNYNGNSFIEDIYNNVSVTFQTQIKNKCMDLITQNLKELENFASIQGREIKTYIDTPFGDNKVNIKPNNLSKKDIEKIYSPSLINYWENMKFN